MGWNDKLSSTPMGSEAIDTPVQAQFLDFMSMYPSLGWVVEPNFRPQPTTNRTMREESIEDLLDYITIDDERPRSGIDSIYQASFAVQLRDLVFTTHRRVDPSIQLHLLEDRSAARRKMKSVALRGSCLAWRRQSIGLCPTVASRFGRTLVMLGMERSRLAIGSQLLEPYTQHTSRAVRTDPPPPRTPNRKQRRAEARGKKVKSHNTTKPKSRLYSKFQSKGHK